TARRDQLHGRVDGGVGRRAQEEELTDAQTQQLSGSRCAPRQGIFEAAVDDAIDLAEAAQGRGHEQAREGTVARLQTVVAGMFVQRLVERPLLLEHRPERIEGLRACGSRWRRAYPHGPGRS